MIINVVFPEFGMSGGVMVALKYVKALTALGHDVLCYAKRLPYLKPNTVKDIAHAVHRMVSHYDADLAQDRCGAFKYQIPCFINNNTIRDADVVIATAWCTAFDVGKLSEAKGRKYYFIQGYEIWDNKEKGIKSYKLPLKHIVIAKWIDNILVGQHGCKKGILVNNGVDLSIFKPDYSRGESNFTISMMYHLLPKKGISDGIKVLTEIHKQCPDIKIIMFGKAEFMDKPDYIEYYRDPEQAQLVKIYQQSNIFLFPAIEEGWGLTVIEAMACGCAIVGTKAGCLLEIGIDGVNALISEPGKPADLECHMLNIIQDKNLQNKLTHNSLKTVKTLSWDESYKKFEKALMD